MKLYKIKKSNIDNKGLYASQNIKDHTKIMKKAIKAAWDPIIIKAMQELITKVETLETKVAALEAE